MRQALLVFAAMFAADIMWAWYIRRTGEGRMWRSATWATACWLPGTFVAVNYIANHWLILPAALGSFFGTAFSVWYDKRQKEVNARKQEEVQEAGAVSHV